MKDNDRMEIRYVLEDNMIMVNATFKQTASPGMRYREYEMNI